MISYIVNLDRSTERFRFVAKQFDKLGIVYERISAVDAEALGIVVEDYQRNVSDWPKLYPPEVACFLSHVICWKKIATGTDDYGAIFEDDIVVSSEIGTYLSSKIIPRGVDVLKIETFMYEVKFSRFGGVRVGGNMAFRAASFHPGTAGYILSKTAARRLLKLYEGGINCPVDHFLFDKKFAVSSSLGVFHLFNALCVQEDRLNIDDPIFSSQIEVRSVNDIESVNLTPTKKTIIEKLYREIKRLYIKLLNKIKYFKLKNVTFLK